MSLPHLNSTQVPNIIFDYWMEKLTPGEFKVLLCICRKTYGWHKTRDSISITQIQKMTGLSRRGIFNSLTHLQELDLVRKDMSKSEVGDNETNYYEIQLEMSAGGGKLSLPGVVNSVHYGVVNSVHPQKKDYTKERHTKEEEGASPPARAPLSSNRIERAPHVFTSDAEHEQLINKWGIEKIESAYQRLSEWKVDTPKSRWKKNDHLAIDRWVITALAEDKQKQKKLQSLGDEESNSSFASKIAENYNLEVGPRKGILIHVSSRYIEFIYAKSPQTPPICIPLSANGFKDQVESALRKTGLK